MYCTQVKSKTVATKQALSAQSKCKRNN